MIRVARERNASRLKRLGLAGFAIFLAAYLTGLSLELSPSRTAVRLANLGTEVLRVDEAGVSGLALQDDLDPQVLLTTLLIVVTFWLGWVTRAMARATQRMAETSAAQSRLERDARREAGHPVIRWEVAEYSQDRISKDDIPFRARMVCRATNYGGSAVIGRIEVPGGHGRAIRPGRLMPSLGQYELEVTKQVEAVDVSPATGWIAARCQIVVVARPVSGGEWRSHRTALLVRGPDRLQSSGEAEPDDATMLPDFEDREREEVDISTLEPELRKMEKERVL